MKNFLFNIIIPSIELDQYLKTCLEKLRKQTYKNFFVTLIVDKKINLKKKYNYKINVIVSRNINMSHKRNLAAKKYKSDYLAFLDSDAYPNFKWLQNANLLYNHNPDEVLGGPNIPFPNENINEIISHYCKRSFFVTAHLSYRKYMSEDRYIDNDYLESCNFFISRKKFLKIGGMNQYIYIGEDKDFFKKLKKREKTNIFFTKKLYVFHKDRNIFNFFKQRFCFGLNVFAEASFRNGKVIAAFLPFILVLSLLTLFFLPISFEVKFHILLYFSLIFVLIVFFEINKFIKKKKLILLVIISIIFSNIFYGTAGIITLMGLKNYFEKKIYRRSR